MALYGLHGEDILAISGGCASKAFDLLFWAIRRSFKDLFFRCVSLKGDLKFLVQSLNFTRHAGKESVCHRCPATKGNEDMSLCYTNISDDALWRSEPNDEPMWQTAPALSRLVGFTKKVIVFDLLHILHLGLLRDLAGTAIKLMTKKASNFYAGSTINKRLHQFTLDLKAWCGEHGIHLSITKIQKPTLGWTANSCPVLKAKGADTLAIIRFISFKFQSQLPADYQGVVACTWAAERFVGCLAEASIFLNENERATAHEYGRLFLHSYLSLASDSVTRGAYLFKVRPKLHFFSHMVDDLVAHPSGCRLRNPYYNSTFVEEDWVKHALQIKKRMSYRKACKNILLRFRVVNKRAMDGLPP